MCINHHVRLTISSLQDLTCF